jgi:outer membrane protein insertion porin family
VRRVVPSWTGRLRLATLLLLLVLGLGGLASGQDVPVQPEQPVPEQEAPPVARNVVTDIHVQGQRRYSAQQIVDALGQKVGQPLDPRAVNEGVKRLWHSFRVRTEVGLIELPGPHPDGIPRIELELHVTEFPSDLEPRFIGYDAVKLKTIKQWALLENKTELFLHQARRVRQRLLEGYQRDGFYWAEVNIVTRGEDEESSALSDVIFEIREGPRVRVTGVEIHGNDSMPDKRAWLFFKDGLSHLAKRELAGKRLTNWFGSKFVRETLDADVLAMRQVYRDRGWLDAVVEVQSLEFNADRNRVTIHIAVDEGQRYRVRQLSIEAYEYGAKTELDDLRKVELELDEAELLKSCRLKPGVVLEKATLARDRETLRMAFGKLGRLYHEKLAPRVRWEFLDPSYTFDVENKTVDVVYRLIQGRRLTIREVRFAGTTHTRDRVLRREVSVFPGDQADLEEINRSLTRIHGTGFFNDEFNQLEHREPYYDFLPVDGDPGAVDLVFEVQEGRVIDFSISGGVDSNDGLFGLLTLSMRNFDVADTPASVTSTLSELYGKEAFHGAGQRLDIEISPGTELSRYRVHFLEPDLFRLHLNPISLDLDLTKRERRYDTHDEDRLEKSVRIGRKFSQDLSMTLGYTHSDVEVSDLSDPAVPPLLSLQETLGEQSVAGPTFDLFWRDLDNYISPRDGFSLRWNNAFNTKALGSDFEFVDTQLHWKGYQPLRERANGTKIVGHWAWDLGVRSPYGDTNDVPYTERFFLGGKNLRGFDFRGVGPMDELSGEPLGGETFATTSFELIYPLHSVQRPGTYQSQEVLRAILFTDAGVLDPEPYQLDPGEIRLSVGFGFGLAYPLPLSLNFGFPVIYKDEDVTQLFSFSLALF